MTSVSQLEPFLEPKSIAVVGANPNTSEQAFNVVENLANCGYQGKVYPVNPNYKKILGKKCYPSVKDIPSAVQACRLLRISKQKPMIIPNSHLQRLERERIIT